MVEVEAYLSRIGYRGPGEPRTEVLRDVHRAHLFSVPFENLDIHLGRPIVLDEVAVTHKVVADRRGGFCYELNGAFAVLLRGLGFQVSRLSAGVMGDHGFGPPFDHLTLEVRTHDDPEPWLADVGFGDGFVEPLRFVVGVEQPQENGTYRVDQEGEHLVLLRRTSADGTFQPQYRFTAEPHDLGDFAEMCRFHQTSPSSHFTQSRVCSLATPEGRVTLSERALIVTRGGERTVNRIRDDAAYREALQQHFGIEVGGDWIPVAGGAR